jgi:hypothetical protein
MYATSRTAVDSLVTAACSESINFQGMIYDAVEVGKGRVGCRNFLPKYLRGCHNGDRKLSLESCLFLSVLLRHFGERSNGNSA